MEFKDWLIEKMAKRELNSASLAEAISENQPTIYRILSGETKNPRLHIVKKLESFFNEDFSRKKIALIGPSLELTKDEIKLLTEFRKIKTEDGVRNIFRQLEMVIATQTKSTGSSAADSIQKTQKIKKDY